MTSALILDTLQAPTKVGYCMWVVWDAFYTSAQRNKLIREACMALRGHCRGEGIPVTNEAKKSLAKLLY